MARQQQLIARVEQLARTDDRIDALLMYGSFTTGEGDAYSDIEFYVYVDDATLPTFDEEAWLGAVAPVRLCYRNEWGITAVIFDDLVRGEFHFVPASEVSDLEAMSPRSWLTSIEDCALYDRSGGLTDALEASLGEAPDRASDGSLRFLTCSVTNGLLMVDQLRRRGEYARAHAVLHGRVHPPLLGLARVVEGATRNWLSPTRRLEEDLSTESYDRYRRTIAVLTPAAIADAATEAWRWFTDLLDALHNPAARLDTRLRQDLDQRLA